MSFEALREAVDGRFIALWTETPQDKVDYSDNNPFTPPQKAPWVRLTTNVTETENGEVGTGFQRSGGKIVVQCFVPLKTGEDILNQLVDAVVAVYQNEHFDGVACFATSPVRVGESGNWYQINAETVFQYDVFS